MIFTGAGQWGYRASNVGSTRPAAAFGTSVSPSATANTYGSYTSLLAGGDILYDCFWVVININSIGISGGAKDAICTIGIDPTGGTSYTDWIPNLLCGQASSHLQVRGGCWYSFPLFVKAGSRIAAKLSCNVASGTAGNVAIWLDGQPRNPYSQFVGYNGVEAIGVNTATSSGTTVTPGTTSVGAWTSLGTSSSPCFYWNYGTGISDGSVSDFNYSADIATGDGSNKHIIVSQGRVFSLASPDTMSFTQSETSADWAVPAGGNIYGRLWCSGAGGDSNVSMAAYGVRY